MFTGPNIITDGLVTYFDVANVDSFRGEPTTNLFQNPLLINETGLASGWANYGSSYEVVSETYNNDVGFSQRFYASPSGTTFRNTGIRLNLIANISQIYTLSFYGKNIETETSISYFAEGWSSLQSNIISLSEGWKFYTLRLTATSTSTILYIRPNGNNVNFGFDSLIYKPQIEQKSYATPFVDGTRGTTVATGGGVADISNNNNHGELVSGPTFNSDNLGSLVFDGVDDSIIVNGNIASISPVSVHGWFNSNGGTSYIVNQFQSTGLSWGIRISPEDRLFLFNDTSNVTNLTHFPFTIENNKWYNFVGGHNTNGFFLYVNGQLIGENANLGGGPTSISGNLILGQRGNNSNFFNGNISQVKIYNRALTADEILQNFNSTKSRFGLS
jgi:hypothetical protein